MGCSFTNVNPPKRAGNIVSMGVATSQFFALHGKLYQIFGFKWVPSKALIP
jgi:hypothetical protein